MSAALESPAEPVAATSAARSEASRINGRCSQGPTSTAGKSRSRANSCRDGLTGQGTVLPPEAAEQVARKQAEYAREFRPRDDFERELVRQMALGAWRAEELATRVFRHDAAYNAERFARWEEDQAIAAAELGRQLADDPETVVAKLRRSAAGCDWLIGRWGLLANVLFTAGEEHGPACLWTDADLALATDLMGCPAGLRHLDGRAGRLEWLRERAQGGEAAAVVELKELIDEQLASLNRKGDEIMNDVEVPLLEGWRAGLELDFETAAGVRLKRYEAAANRLFHSALRTLERHRRERGEPLRHAEGREPAPDHARPSPPPAPPSPPPPARTAATPVVSRPSAPLPPRTSPLSAELAPLFDTEAAPLDLWVGGRPGGR